ncbi:MAG: tetratricopeptide repeat protein [Chloroflexi bacterium]|nr:tetratricopeptide repeat protein [Chloroflexota bacterium]
MVAEPELPDFDSMPQDELLAWLVQLARDRGDAPPQSDDKGANNGDWLDDTQRSLTVQPPADDDTPTDLLLGDADIGLPPDAIDWLREIAAVEASEELPDITDYRPPEPGISLSDILRASPEDDALAWLDNLAAEISNSPRMTNHDSAVPNDYGSDFNEDFEDDESLDDLEDESLYSPRGKRRGALVAALLGLDDAEAADQRTQSMAPLSEENSPAQADAAPVRQSDRLTQAFALHAEADDLEAWYAERLAALDKDQPAQPKFAPQPAIEPAPEPPASENQPKPQSTIKLPPPGLAAAINSARAKVTADALDEALEVYETLLSTPAGLDWVEMDMRALIDLPAHTNDPALHRVLGDALMRSGRLDEALAAYRHALSLL